MAVTAYWYSHVPLHAFNKEIDYDDGNLKVALMNGGSLGQNTYEVFSHVNGYEISGAGYVAGGKALTDPRLLFENEAQPLIKFRADDIQWNSASFTAHWAVVYYNTGVPATSPLLFAINFGQDIEVRTGTFKIAWADGLEVIGRVLYPA